MLKIRLQRVGRKHEPTFRLVLTDAENSTKSGRFNEILGSYDARKTTEKFNVDRISHWLSMGARPTDTVHNLLVTHKIIDAKKKNVLPKKTAPEKVEEPMVATPEVKTEAQAEEVISETPVVETPEPVVSEPEVISEVISEPVVEESIPETKVEDAPAEDAPIVEAESLEEKVV